jgi:hypothetical protein
VTVATPRPRESPVARFRSGGTIPGVPDQPQDSAGVGLQPDPEPTPSSTTHPGWKSPPPRNTGPPTAPSTHRQGQSHLRLIRLICAGTGSRKRVRALQPARPHSHAARLEGGTNQDAGAGRRSDLEACCWRAPPVAKRNSAARQRVDGVRFHGSGS